MAKKVAYRLTPRLRDVFFLLAASPVYALVGTVRLVRRVKFARLMQRGAIACRTCGGDISLVGFWRCGCGFTYRGHVLRLCPVCRTLPQVVRCEHCGATERVRR